MDQPTQDAVQAWIADMVSSGRVPTRLPFSIGLVQAGQLGSRLQTANPALGVGPAQWDYQPAPFLVRVADNWQATTDEVAADIASTFSADALGQAVGSVAHVVVETAGAAVATALGIPTWALWGGLAFGAYYVLTHVEGTKRYVDRWAA